MKEESLFSSESVTEGHPDKLCDQISDAIVDRFLQHDPGSRVSAECAAAHAIIFIAARFSSESTVDLPDVARQVMELVGYREGALNSKTCSIVTSLQELPPDKDHFPDRQLSDEELEQIPARQHASVFGFACSQTPSLMPLPIWLAHRLARRLASVRLQKILPYLAPDGKARVGVEYRNRLPVRIHSLSMVASQHPGGPELAKLRNDIREAVIVQAFNEEVIQPDHRTEIYINPEGSFPMGGPSVHAGLTGRKNTIDLYGGYARQSGAALSGKDPGRIDRVAAYAARYAAKNVVAAGIAKECEILLSYSIGRSRPVSVQAESFGTGVLPDAVIGALVEKVFDFRLAGIVQQFNLRRLPMLVRGGFYRKLAAYGHVGRMDLGLPWELVDKVAQLRDLAGLKG